jgi:hypothetical protein
MCLFVQCPNIDPSAAFDLYSIYLSFGLDKSLYVKNASV